MNELLFFGIAAIIVGLSYYLGHESGIKKNIKAEVRDFVMGLTVSRMTHEYFQRCALNETRDFLKALGVQKIKEKHLKNIRLPTIEDIDRLEK